MGISIAALAAIGITPLATESAVAQLAEKKALTLEAARKMVAAAETAAEDWDRHFASASLGG
jgi:hypothetical protein